MGDIEEIKIKHPSICYNCNLSRKPASDENIKLGYVGCCLRVVSPIAYDWDQITKAEEIAEGWVDLRSKLKLGKGSGIISNFQLLTKGVESCKKYEQT